MAKTYDELICEINNISVQEIITKEFPGDITAARVGVRVSIIMNEINEKFINLSKQISQSFEKQNEKINERFGERFDQVEGRLDEIEKRLDAICDKLGIELDEE